MSNLVQELVDEIGPNNPALLGNFQMSSAPTTPPKYSADSIPPPTQPMVDMQFPPALQQQPPPQMMPPPPMQVQMTPQQMMVQPEVYASDEKQLEEVSNFSRFGFNGAHKPLIDRAIQQLRELLYLSVSFVLLSLPQIDQFIYRVVPQLSAKPYYIIVAKGLLFSLLYYLVKYFDLV